MAICLNCGKETKGYLCDECRQIVDLEELISKISVYTPSGKKAQIYTARKNGNLQNEVSTVDLTDDKVTIYVSYTNA